MKVTYLDRAGLNSLEEWIISNIPDKQRRAEIYSLIDYYRTHENPTVRCPDCGHVKMTSTHYGDRNTPGYTPVWECMVCHYEIPREE